MHTSEVQIVKGINEAIERGYLLSGDEYIRKPSIKKVKMPISSMPLKSRQLLTDSEIQEIKQEVQSRKR